MEIWFGSERQHDGKGEDACHWAEQRGLEREVPEREGFKEEEIRREELGDEAS